MFKQPVEANDFFNFSNPNQTEYKVYWEQNYFMEGNERIELSGGELINRLIPNSPYLSALSVSNMLLDNKYEEKRRRIPAHIPYPIDSSIMHNLQSLFPKEFARTSSNLLRSVSDLQITFLYNNYLKEESLTNNSFKLTEVDGLSTF
jgi:hypothetical protein